MNKHKRLTKRKKDGSIVLNYFSHDFAPSDLIAHRLAELEDKIEAGTFVELPCKIGDVIYEVIGDACIDEWEIESICFNKTYPKGVIWAERTRDFAPWKFWVEDCGTKWFVTKTEAEKKLKEMKNGI